MTTATTTETEYIGIAEAAKMAPTRPHATGVWRWMRKGLLCRNGERVRLRHVRVGRCQMTTREWLREFFEAVAAADMAAFEGGVGEQTTKRTPGRATSARRRDRDIDAALEHVEAKIGPGRRR